MALLPNTHLGRYEVRTLLGVGGMGEVYLAQDTTLNRVVLAVFARQQQLQQSRTSFTQITVIQCAASDSHRKLFWARLRNQNLKNALQGVDVALRRTPAPENVESTFTESNNIG